MRVPTFLLSVSSGSSIQRCAVAFDAVWMTVVSSLSFFERGDEAGRVPRQRHAGGVGEVLALPADRELHEPGDDRREDQQDDADDREDRADRVVALVAAPPAAAPEHEAQEEVGERARGSRPS